ncbi:MAG: hypothetical protein Q4G63_04425 [Bacteroidia bacterium]|nr:hypothetical protein [Bacteroidia bacterium]
MTDIIDKLEREKQEAEGLRKPTVISTRRRGRAKAKEKTINSLQELLSKLDSQDLDNSPKKRITIQMEHRDKIVLPLLDINPKDLLRLLLDDFYEQPEIKKLINQNLKFRK